MKSLHAMIAALGLLAALAAPAAAQSDLDRIKADGALKIGTEGTYAPFTYHDPSGALVGFDVEIGREIAKRLGVKAQFQEGKWDGLIAGLDANRYDAVINEVGITDQRKQKYDFSEPYIASKAVIIVKASDDTIKTFADLKGKKAAQSLTSNFGKLAEKNGAVIVGTDGFDQSIQLVLQGRADATLNDSLSFYDFQEEAAEGAREDHGRGSGCRLFRRHHPQKSTGTAGRDQQGLGRHQGRRHLQDHFGHLFRPGRVEVR